MGIDTSLFGHYFLAEDRPRGNRLLSWCKKNKEIFYMWKPTVIGVEFSLSFKEKYRVDIETAMKQFLLIAPILRKYKYTGPCSYIYD